MLAVVFVLMLELRFVHMFTIKSLNEFHLKMCLPCVSFASFMFGYDECTDKSTATCTRRRSCLNSSTDQFHFQWICCSFDLAHDIKFYDFRLEDENWNESLPINCSQRNIIESKNQTESLSCQCSRKIINELLLFPPEDWTSEMKQCNLKDCRCEHCQHRFPNWEIWISSKYIIRVEFGLKKNPKKPKMMLFMTFLLIWICNESNGMMERNGSWSCSWVIFGDKGKRNVVLFQFIYK